MLDNESGKGLERRSVKNGKTEACDLVFGTTERHRSEGTDRESHKRKNEQRKDKEVGVG